MTQKLKLSVIATAAVILTANMANSATMSCSWPNGKVSYSLGNATAAQCVTPGNDTNLINKSYSVFGMTGWTLASKNDSSDGNGTIKFTSAPSNGAKSGSWTLDTLAGLDNVFITLKAGNGFGAFLLDTTVANPLAGTWASSKGLSHASIYYNGTPVPPSPVPLPASLPLLLGALGLLGMFKRRKLS